MKKAALLGALALISVPLPAAGAGARAVPTFDHVVVVVLENKVQRDVLTPNDLPSMLALEKTLQTYFAELNQHPKPIQWTYTKTKLLAKFGAPPPLQLAA